MKKVLTAFLLTVMAGLGSCSDDTTGPSTNNSTAGSHDYFPTSKGSTWTFQQEGGIGYTITMTGDSTLNGKKYAKQQNSIINGVGLSRVSKDTVINFDPASGNEQIALISTPIGASWSLMTYAQNGTQNEQEFIVKESGLTHEVNGKKYTNVMRVHLTTSIIYGGEKFTAIESDYYFAKNIGLIEMQSPAAHVYLTSYEIK